MRQKLLIVLLAIIVGVYFTFPTQTIDEEVYRGPVTIESYDVMVNGEVNMPKTFRFFNDVTVSDVIMMSKGLTDLADDATIPFHQVISSNTTLNINRHDEEVKPINILVNVNEASFSELLNVPYMSESRVAYLIMYREEHGDFQSLDELINVKYIGAATLEQIKAYLTVS